ncbi:MAG: helix-turn-helix transcriptional regulator [Lawsonibacter sp.]|nr:helix-turn-helix transcriptional regulator [Lawsonibacter sp.]
MAKTLAHAFSDCIRRFRAQRRLSAEEFAKELGIGRTSLLKIERDEANPTLDTVEMVAGNLGIPPLNLLGGTDPAQAVSAQLLMYCLKNGVRFSSLSIREIGTLLLQIADIAAGEEARIEAEADQVPASAPPPPTCL